mgnify:CR=1 FL=1
MNFTASPFERMMKETPHPGWDNDDLKCYTNVVTGVANKI